MPAFRPFAFLSLQPDYSKRIFGLDLMRALAIFFVVMGHGSMLEKADTGFPWVALVPGVELFFVLSGFLIGGILLRLFRESPDFGFPQLKKFWIRRWFRTLPNYYLVLILNIIAVYFGWINEKFSHFNWTFFLFLQNFSGPFTDFFWESWSLSVEEWFYILFPLTLAVVLLAGHILQRKDAAPGSLAVAKNKLFLFSILVFLLVPFLLRLCIASRMQVDQFWLGVKIFKVVIFRLDSIALGLFAAFIKDRYPGFWFTARKAGFVLGLILIYTILYTTWPPDSFLTKNFQIFLQSLGCFLLLPGFDSIRRAPRRLVRIVTHVSLISYSMYLLNLALIAEVINKNFPPRGPRSAWGMYFLYCFAVVFFSTLMYKYFEKPTTEMRDRYAS